MVKIPVRSGAVIRRWPWSLPILIGAILRFVYWREYAASPLFEFAIGADVGEYDARAHEILSGVWMPAQLDIHGPLYSFFLAFAYWITGISIPAVRLLQLVVNWMAAAVLPWGVYRWGNIPRRIALVFLWSSMVVTTPFFYQAELVSEALLLPLIALTILLLYRFDSETVPRRRFVWSALGGLAGGLVAVTHPMSLLFVGFEAFSCLRNAARRRAGVLFLIGAALPIVLASSVNSVIAHRMVFIQGNSAFNLWLGNNPNATGGCYIRPGSEWSQVHRHAENVARERGISVDRHFLGEAADFWIHSPLRAVGLVLKKAVMIFSPGELPSGADSDFLVRYTKIQRFGAILTLPLFLFCAWGIVVALRRKMWCCDHFGLLLLAGFLAQLITVTSGRYRMMMMPAIFFFAAVGIESIPWRRPRYWLLGTGLLLLGTFVAAPRFSRGQTEAAELFGEVALRRGELHDARRYLSFALPGSHDAARLRNMLGIIHWNLGDTEKAEAEFRRIAAETPDEHEAFMNLALLLAEQPSRRAETAAAFDAALARFPDVADLQYNYGRFLQDEERWVEAEAAYRRAVELQKMHQPALVGLGIVALHDDRPAEAVKWFEQALALTPGDPRLIRNLAFACRVAGDESRARALEKKAAEINNSSITPPPR